MTAGKRTMFWRITVLIFCILALVVLFLVKAYRKSVLNDALIAAVLKGDLAGTQRMLKLEADPESQEYVKRTAGSGFVSRILSVINPPRPGRRALFIACVQLHLNPAYGPVAECLVKAGAHAENQSEPPGYVMNSVAKCGSASLLSQLLAHGAKVDEVDSEDMTPLMYAADTNASDKIKVLLSNGANPNLRCKSRDSVIELVFFSTSVEDQVVEMTSDLLNHHADPNGKMSWNPKVTYYSYAMSREWNRVAKLLLAHGARPEGEKEYRHTLD